MTLTGANTFTGTLIGNSTSLQGDMTNDATVEFAQATSGIYSGSMSGPGNLTKTGAGALTLSGANTYAGTTTISAGTLVAASNSALGATAGFTTGAAR